MYKVFQMIIYNVHFFRNTFICFYDSVFRRAVNYFRKKVYITSKLLKLEDIPYIYSISTHENVIFSYQLFRSCTVSFLFLYSFFPSSFLLHTYNIYSWNKKRKGNFFQLLLHIHQRIQNKDFFFVLCTLLQKYVYTYLCGTYIQRLFQKSSHDS